MLEKIYLDQNHNLFQHPDVFLYLQNVEHLWHLVDRMYQLFVFVDEILLPA